MKRVPVSAQDPDRPQSLEELRCRLNRRVSDFRDGWKGCDNPECRRERQCRGEGPDFKCTNDGRPRRTLSPEESAKVRSDLYKAIKARRAELAAGVQPPDAETPRQLREEPRAAARRGRKSARALAAKTVAPSPQVHRDEPPTPPAEETQLAPEKQVRIDRAWNDYVASLPAEDAETEDADERTRERRPRITQL